MSSDGRCGATREGRRVNSGRVVMWRGSCRSYPLKGFAHCEFHLTGDERGWRVEKIGNPRGRIALYLDEAQALDIAYKFGLDDEGSRELLAAIERAYPEDPQTGDV